MLRLEHVRQYMVCAMKCGVAPSQPTDEHHSTMCVHPVGYIDEALLHDPRTIPSTRVT